MAGAPLSQRPIWERTELILVSALFRVALQEPASLSATIDHLTRALYAQRHAEDTLGPRLIGPMNAGERVRREQVRLAAADLIEAAARTWLEMRRTGS